MLLVFKFVFAHIPDRKLRPNSLIIYYASNTVIYSSIKFL